MRARVYRRWPRVWVVTTTTGDGRVFPTWRSAYDWANDQVCAVRYGLLTNDDEGSGHDNWQHPILLALREQINRAQRWSE